MPQPIYTHLVNLSHSVDLKSFDFAQNLKISISISAFCSILEEDGFTFGSPCWMCEMFLQKPQDSELLDVTNTNLYSKTPFVSGMYIFLIYNMILIGFSRNIMVEFLFSYFMLGWNGTWVVNNVSRPKTKGKFSIEMSRCFPMRQKIRWAFGSLKSILQK